MIPKSCQQIVNKDKPGDFYLKFIDNKTNEIEAATRTCSSGPEVTYEESINLFQLCGKINAIHYKLCYNSETQQMYYGKESSFMPGTLQPLLPGCPNHIMFIFPIQRFGTKN